MPPISFSASMFIITDCAYSPFPCYWTLFKFPPPPLRPPRRGVARRGAVARWRGAAARARGARGRSKHSARGTVTASKDSSTSCPANLHESENQRQEPRARCQVPPAERAVQIGNRAIPADISKYLNILTVTSASYATLPSRQKKSCPVDIYGGWESNLIPYLPDHNLCLFPLFMF